MVLLGFYSIYRYGKDIQVKTPVLLLLASILIPLVSWYFAHLAYPDWVNKSPRLDKLSRIFVFIPIAWWLKDSPKKVFLFWAAAALTIILAPWIGGGGWQEIIRGWHGGRIDYALRNAGHTSLFFGLILIGLLCFLPRLYRWKRIALIFWLPITLFCIFTMVAAQTRAAWLALIASAVISCFVILFNKKFRQKINIKNLSIFIIITLAVTFTIYKTMGNTLEHRSTSESSVIEKVMSGNLKDIPYTSVGIRIHLWEAGLDKIKERPLLGWGNKGQRISIDQNDWMPENIKQNFGHLHNIYLSILNNYGFIGLAFYFIWFGWVMIKILKAVSRKQLDRDIGHFAITAFTFWSVVNLFESYLFFWTGVFCIQVIFGGLLAFIWNAEINNKTEKES
ncbi:O-antigen ligase family protein [Marinomonas sp. TI.3.20]|uniref:O-antigen ligase family protein n=1 Tax=Marinomonas sp. TI.3.20 TaxID=3121296 RepID=UPI0031202557